MFQHHIQCNAVHWHSIRDIGVHLGQGAQGPLPRPSGAQWPLRALHESANIPVNDLDTVPKKEAFAMMQSDKCMHSIVQVLVQCDFNVNKALLGIDALSIYLL